MGEFMKYLPITLIIVLSSSLFVALVLIPVISATFIKRGDQNPEPRKKRSLIAVIIMLALSALAYMGNVNSLGSLLVIFALIGLMNILFLSRASKWFQTIFLIRLEGWYLLVIRYVLRKRNPYYFMVGTFLLLILTISFYFLHEPEIVNFPSSDPQYINILAELPIGSDISASDEFMYELEDNVFEILEPYQPVVKSVLTTVGSGAKAENEMFDLSDKLNRGLITVNFIDFEDRGEYNTNDVLEVLTEELIGAYPGIRISIAKQMDGPPSGKPINLEITGRDFEQLLYLTDTIMTYIDRANIDGIEGLKIDLNVGKPELIVTIDRDKSRRFGVSTAQIASTIRTALFGREVSDFKVGEDEYPIQVRLQEKYRYNLSALMNQSITFRSQSSGKIQQVPISSVADVHFSTTYGEVKRIDMERAVTIYSNVLEGYNATKINEQLKGMMLGFEMPAGYNYAFTGEQEEQEESMVFLMTAMLIAVCLIIVILVSQFNSIVKPLIIISSVFLSTIGVFGGLATFKMDFVVIMTGIGIVSLAGVVVNNAIVLIDYIDLLKKRKRNELGMEPGGLLPADLTANIIIEGGKTRLRPVLLTAITTILGLFPLAVGLNIDFVSLLENFDPQLYMGGDNVAFWGPMSWTIIFGLTFATFLTLVIVPAMYYLLYLGKISIYSRLGRK